MSKWYSELQAVGVYAWTVIPEGHDHKGLCLGKVAKTMQNFEQ